jgi:hypothetical protein
VYSWHQDYIAAILETDGANLPDLIYEAITAIEQRALFDRYNLVYSVQMMLLFSPLTSHGG